MEYINHYTINTSHNRISYPGEVDKSIYFKIAKIIKKAAAGERPEVIDGTYITLTSELDCYAATLWADEKTPLLLTVGAKSEEGRKKVSNLIINDYKGLYEETPILPAAPVVADVILPSCIFMPKVLEWSGDFTRCLGWALMAPEKIR